MLRAVLIPVLLAAAACGSGTAAGGDDDLVVAGFYPLAWAAEQVAADGTTVRDLTPAGAEPHDLEITTTQLDLIESAGTVVLLGGGFQPSLEDAAGDDAVLVLDELGISGEVEEHAHGPKGDASLDDHAHDHFGDAPERDDHEEPAPEEGDHDEGLDPHVWLDPLRMADIVDIVAEAMGRTEQAGPVRERLEALHAQYEDGLADCDRDLIVTAHEAFGWLVDRYGLRHESLTGVSPEQEPDPRRLAQLADLVRDEGVTTIFTEELVSPRVAEALAREAGVETATLDPIEGAGGDYISRMEENLAALREALGCR